jgi:DNA-binding transcriptional regulator PaaX
MNVHSVATSYRASWPLTAQEAAHAMPVLQSVHPGLRAAPAPRLSTIRHLAHRWGIRDGTLRTALSRACSTGSLEAADGRYRLGPVSIEEAAAARARLTRVPGYTLGVALEGRQGDLAHLRVLLVRLGFRSLQRSVWVGARTSDDRLRSALRRAGLEGSVVVFECDEVDADARARLSMLWRLPERAAEVRRFHLQLIDYVTEPRIGAREAAWRCVEVAPVWYRVAVRDEPPLPLDFCGPDYPLDRLNGDWRAHLESMTGELVDLWRSEER